MLLWNVILKNSFDWISFFIGCIYVLIFWIGGKRLFFLKWEVWEKSLLFILIKNRNVIVVINFFIIIFLCKFYFKFFFECYVYLFEVLKRKFIELRMLKSNIIRLICYFNWFLMYWNFLFYYFWNYLFF